MSHNRESKLPPPKPEQTHSPEAQTRAIEYVDAGGKKICDVRVELEKPEPYPDNPSKTCQRIKRFILLGQKDQKPTEVDLMQLVGAEASGTTAYLVEGTDINTSGKKNGQQFIAVSSLNDALAAATFLHEFGHIAQAEDPRLDGIRNKYSLDRLGKENTPIFDLDRIQQVADATNLELTDAQRHALKVIEGLEDKINTADIDLRVARTMLEQVQAGKYGLDPTNLKAMVEEYEQQIVSNQEKLTELNAILTNALTALKPIIDLPKRMLERDATARAFKNMRKIRQETGINLFAPVRKHRNALTDLQRKYVDIWKPEEKPKTDCGEATEGLLGRVWSRMVGRKQRPEPEAAAPSDPTVVMDARFDLADYALFTYDARMRDMRKIYGRAPMAKKSLPPEEEVIEELDASIATLIDEEPVVKAIPAPPKAPKRRTG
jgi:hypothetical protein